MRWLILDEADKLFDMGFTQQVGCASVVSALQIVQLLRGNSAWMGAHGTCMGGWGDCTASSRMFIRLTGCWLVPRGALPQSAAALLGPAVCSWVLCLRPAPTFLLHPTFLLLFWSADRHRACGLHPQGHRAWAVQRHAAGAGAAGRRVQVPGSVAGRVNACGPSWHTAALPLPERSPSTVPNTGSQLCAFLAPKPPARFH